MPGGVFGTVANVIKTVPCLSKETLEGGFLFGVGMDSGGPSITIQCRRASCYTCLATSTFSVSPFGGLVSKMVQEFTKLFEQQAADVVRDTLLEYASIQEQLLHELDAMPVAEEQKISYTGASLTPVATNSGWSLTS